MKLFKGFDDNDRFERACDLVQRINHLAWSGNDSFKVGVSKQVAGKQCPLCIDNNTCLGSSCLGTSGI